MALGLGQVNANAAKKAVPKPVDHRILIASVDVAAQTVEVLYKRDNTKQTYKVDSSSQIKVSNAPGTLSDIKVGMQVSDYVERDSSTLDSIAVKTAEPPPKA